jgi:acyl carrier protein
MTKHLSPEQIESLLKEFLVEHFDVPSEKMTGPTALRELGIDSIMMLDIMLEMEDRLDVKFKDLSMPANPRLDDIVALIERNLAASEI